MSGHGHVRPQRTPLDPTPRHDPGPAAAPPGPSAHGPVSSTRAAGSTRFLDAEDPSDLHGLLVRYFGNPAMMKLRSVQLPGSESMSFFYARIHTDLLLTPTHKYIVVAVLNNTEELFAPARTRLAELGHWTGFQTRTFESTDLPLVSDAIAGYDRPTISPRETPLSLIRIHASAPALSSSSSRSSSSSSGSPTATAYLCAEHPNLRVTLVPISDRVQLASKGNLREALETFQCVLERV